MKVLLLFLGPLLYLPALVAQDVIIKGRVTCIVQAPSSTKGAENVIVVPSFVPSQSTITATSPTGYFEFNTRTDLSLLQDKQVNVYLVSGCRDCRESVYRLFVSEDQDRQNKDDSKSYVTISRWKTQQVCLQLEMPPLVADSLLTVIVQQTEEDLSELGAATVASGTPALLNLLTSIASVGPYSAGGTFLASGLDPGKIPYGEFLSASALYHTGNMGFNFSPGRDFSEAAFWNPSALAFSPARGQVSLFTNIKNQVKLGGHYRLDDRISIGVGGIVVSQDEFRDATYIRSPGEPDDERVRIDSTHRKLREISAQISPSFKINKQLSAGVSLKSVWQDFDIPDLLELIPDRNGEFYDIKIKRQVFDLDLSLSYKPTKFLQLGLNAMNLLDSELYSDAFLPDNENPPVRGIRALGLGANYKWVRFNFGADVILGENGIYDAAFGVNYIPFNDVLISAGISALQKSHSLAIRLRNFRLAYVDDRQWLVNEQRKGRSGILNGRLYGGFAFTF
jgi:hypothetical protein